LTTVPTTSDPVATLASLRAKKHDREQRAAEALRDLDAVNQAMPTALRTYNMAVVDSQADGDAAVSEAMDAVRKLELTKTNATAVLGGVEAGRDQLNWQIATAERDVARALATSKRSSRELAELATECLEAGLNHFAVLVQNEKACLAALPRDDQRGAAEGWSEAHVARWLRVLVAQSGLDLDLARHITSGVGTDPTTAHDNLTAVLRML